MESAVKARSGAANVGRFVMVLSLLGVGGFLYWLSVTSESTEVVVVAPPVEYNEVAFSEFSASPEAYVGVEVMLRSVPVVSLVGRHAFFTSLEDAQGTAYLLHLSRGLVADSVAVQSGDVVDVNGVVAEMSDSVMSDWEAMGSVTNEGERSLALYASHFVEIVSLEALQGADAPAADSMESSEPSP